MPLWAWIAIGLACIWGLLELNYRRIRARDAQDNRDFIRENKSLHRFLWATIVRPPKIR